MFDSERPRGAPLIVLAQGEHWVVVAKPPGLFVHRDERMPGVEAAVQTVRNQLRRHVYPIHRIDRHASGCLLFATTRSWAGPLSTSLSEGRKSYLAFVRGAFVGDGPVSVDTPMKDDTGTVREAHSVVWCIGRSDEPRCSLLRVEPRTGRFHQVRRHVRDLHHPVICDTEHGDTRVNRWWREHAGMQRLGLHAHSLSLALPDGARIDVECPLFEDHAAVWRALPWWPDALAALPSLGLPTIGSPAQPPTEG